MHCLKSAQKKNDTLKQDKCEGDYNTLEDRSLLKGFMTYAYGWLTWGIGLINSVGDLVTLVLLFP